MLTGIPDMMALTVICAVCGSVVELVSMESATGVVTAVPVPLPPEVTETRRESEVTLQVSAEVQFVAFTAKLAGSEANVPEPLPRFTLLEVMENRQVPTAARTTREGLASGGDGAYAGSACSVRGIQQVYRSGAAPLRPPR